MIVQCPACRALVDVRAVSVEPDRAGLACSACGVTSWLPAAEAAESAEGSPPPAIAQAPLQPASPPASAAPSAAPPPATEAVADELVAALEALPVPEAGEALRQELIALLGKWDDEPSHKALIQRASMTDQLPVVGQAYRVVLEHRKNDAMATRGRDLVLTTAMASLTPSVDTDALARTRKTITAVVAVFCALLIAAVGWFVLRPQLTAEDPSISANP